MLETFLVLTAILLPLLLSALLSATETAITAMSTAKIHKLKNDGNKSAAIVSKLREDKEGLISTILLTNNACNILASTIATAFLIESFGSEGVIYATFIMTIIIIIFAEVLPKTYSLANPERVALNFAKFLKVIVTICRPITFMINHIVEFIIAKLSLQQSSAHFVSPTEEIKGAIELHHQEGAVDNSDKYMLDGVFYLGETHVGNVMTHRTNMQTINLELTTEEIITQVKSIGHTRIPVWKDNQDNIVGILNVRDLLQFVLMGNELNKVNIADLISDPMFVHENTALDEQLSEFKRRKTRFAMVIDEYGGIQGLITLADILEEVVGHIQDEHDVEKEEISYKEGFCIVKGKLTIRDLNRALNWQLPDEDAATIAGLIIHEAERIPEVGEKLAFHGFLFTILAKEANHLTEIKIEQNSDV
jgi:Mg2+/Co2+ transporter CorB